MQLTILAGFWGHFQPNKGGLNYLQIKNNQFPLYSALSDTWTMSGSKIIDFRYQFRSKDLTSTLTVPVTIPSPQPASDLVGRLVNAHNLPCYVEEGKKRSNFRKKCWKNFLKTCASTTFHVMKRKVKDGQNAPQKCQKIKKKKMYICFLYLPCLIKRCMDKWPKNV